MADILTLVLQAWLEKASRWIERWVFALRNLNRNYAIKTILRLEHQLPHHTHAVTMFASILVRWVIQIKLNAPLVYVLNV